MVWRWRNVHDLWIDVTVYVGQLDVSMYDPAQKQLVWRGGCDEDTRSKAKPEKKEKNITKAVAKLLKNFPPKPKVSRLFLCQAVSLRGLRQPSKSDSGNPSLNSRRCRMLAAPSASKIGVFQPPPYRNRGLEDPSPRLCELQCSFCTGNRLSVFQV